ncbi:MAG: carbohydrate binding family 9 domain-containing protein [Proteobacteria bacterium]|nr:carbohydrate binding family 9 domain-containing protein [Pseudomonadota bacterium]MDA0896653.1 carbohydrate binding family 9 domain-containing protein [Pseudomonadota bacterium]
MFDSHVNSKIFLLGGMLLGGIALQQLSLAQESELQERGVEAKSFRAVKVASAPVLDGKLDDEVWQQAERITDFHQSRPGDHAEPSEETELYVVYTEDALYVAARMYDSNPELISAPTIRHGQGLPFDDRLVIILDPFNQSRAGYRFETNLNGVRHDSLYETPTSFRLDWNTIWETATSIDGKSWVAEVEIPFKSLPFDPRLDTWGFNFGRGIRRRNEEMSWVSLDRTYNPTIMGEMSGLEGMNQGLGLDIVPSFIGLRQRSFSPSASDNSLQPSLDAFYRLTPSLNAALTVNTDFSAVEVDNRQVNLTRFNLFFPEKRDFFLNDSDLFQFGDISRMAAGNNATGGAGRENARPYFSRKLGLAADGSPVDIEYGGRISGRVGRFNIGTLAIRQGESENVAAADMLVTRISANVLDDSRIGFIYTNGDPTSNVDNSVMGADFMYVNNDLGAGRRLQSNVFFQQSDTPGLFGDDASYGFGLALPASEGLRTRVGYKVVEDNFNPAMGFVNRTNIEDITADLGYTYFFEKGLIQTAFAGIDLQRVNVIDGGLQSEVVAFRLLELESNTRDSIRLTYVSNKEVVRAPFRIYRDPSQEVVIQPGSYEFDEQEFGISSGGQRKFSGSFSYKTGDFYNGSRENVNASFTWNQSRYFTATIRSDWNDIVLPQGSFITRLTSANSQIAFSPTLYWISLVQYDNLSEEIGINTRLQWIPKAGQEAFIVLNHNMQDWDRDNTFHSARSDLSIKFRYTFRF